VYEYFTLSFLTTASLLSEDSITFSDDLEGSLEPTLCSKPTKMKPKLTKKNNKQTNKKLKEELVTHIISRNCAPTLTTTILL
jgi:hypothetical protein